MQSIPSLPSRDTLGVYSGGFSDSSGFSPLSLSPALWVSDTGSDPSIWTDMSGNGRHAVQATAGSRPVIIANALNGRQVRRFDGIDDVLIPPDFNLDTHSVFCVIIPNITTGLIAGTTLGITIISSTDFSRDTLNFVSNSEGVNYYNISRSDGSSYPNARAAISNLTPQITTGKYTGTELIAYVNNGTRNTFTTTNSGSSGNKVAIGAAREGVIQYFYKGDIAEIIAYPTSLSDFNCLQVERYLGSKYGIAV